MALVGHHCPCVCVQNVFQVIFQLEYTLLNYPNNTPDIVDGVHGPSVLVANFGGMFVGYVPQ